MKRIASIALILMFVFGLAACGETGTTAATTAPTTATTLPGTTTTTEYHDPVTVTYAAWNLGAIDSDNLEREMLSAFTEAYPWITVEIVERPMVPDPSGIGEVLQIWNEFLGARAAQGILPDVFFTDSTEVVITNNWSREMSDIALEDPEFMNIPADIRDAANYQGNLMALPYAIYYFGYYVNKTLFENNNADYPVFTDSWDEFIGKIALVAKQNVTDGSGVGGLFGIDRIPEWYPAQLSEELGWYTYDGSILHLDGAEFEASLELMWDLAQDKTLVMNALTPEELEAAGLSTQAWESGRLAAYWDASWNLASMLDREFEVDFIATPGTEAAHQIPIVLDLMCVSSQTDHPEEAYLLSKWMSFGKAGYLKRIELSQLEDGTGEPLYAALNMTPLQPDEELLDAFFEIYPTFTEFRTVIASQEYIIEPFKHVPGYATARWNEEFNAVTTVGDIYNAVLAQQVNYADVKTTWNGLANDALARARATVFEKLGIEE